MRRFPIPHLSGLLPNTLSLVLLCGPAVAAEPVKDPAPAPSGGVQQAQLTIPERPPEQPAPQSTVPPTQAQPVAPPSTSLTPPAATAGPAPATSNLGSVGGAVPAGARTDAGVLPQTSANVVSGAESQTRAATDVGSLLGKSLSDPGVFVQQRNPIVSDPRIRSYHVGQIYVQADGAFWQPARPDLDTIVSKLDASMIRDIIIIKGPYSSHYGPAFSFLDVVTYDTPRYQNGTEAHEMTILGYQTNGNQWRGRQSFWGGGQDWGFRVGYGILSGSDYQAGNGYTVPASYNSQDVDFGFGYNFSPDSRFEVKGMRLQQRGVEFPGMYFDISHLFTEAYTAKYELRNQDYFDLLSATAWYNRTDATGNTQQGAKNLFISDFLSAQPGLSAFQFGVTGPGGAPTPGTFTPTVIDRSFTNFNTASKGYRLATTWGQQGNAQLTAGTDLNYVTQYLAEYIRFDRLVPPAPAPDLVLGGSPVGEQNLGIPHSTLVDPGLYLEGALPVGKRLTLKSGFRYDQILTDSEARLVSGNVRLFPPVPGGALQPPLPGVPGVVGFDPIIYSTNPNDTRLARNMSLWSTYLTGEYAIDQHLTALGGFGYAQRPPTLTELYAAGPFVNLLQQGLTRTVGDPHLKPEKLKQMDLALKGNYGWYRGGVSGFFSWIDDYITWDQVSNAVPFNGITGSSNNVVFTNTDRATLAGGEAYGEADVTKWLTPFGTLGYVQGRDLTHIDNRRGFDPARGGALVSSRTSVSQEPLPNIPPLVSNVGFRIHEAAPNPRWTVEMATRIVNGQNLVARSLNEVPTSGYTIWNLRSYWRMSDNLLLTGGVENIGNTYYRQHLDPRSGAPTDLLFQPGRNFYFGMQLQY